MCVSRKWLSFAKWSTRKAAPDRKRNLMSSRLPSANCSRFTLTSTIKLWAYCCVRESTVSSTLRANVCSRNSQTMLKFIWWNRSKRSRRLWVRNKLRSSEICHLILDQQMNYKFYNRYIKNTRMLEFCD